MKITNLSSTVGLMNQVMKVRQNTLRQLEQLKDYCNDNVFDIQDVVKGERSGHSQIGNKSLSDIIGQESGKKNNITCN